MRYLPVFGLLVILLAACAGKPARPARSSQEPPTESPAAPTPEPPTATPQPSSTGTLQPSSTPTPQPATVTSTAELPGPQWNLVWADEFNLPDGAPVDASKWSAEMGGGGWGNAELEYYTDRPENAYHENGSLVIRARNEEYQGSRYTSARLVTKGKASWKYGRIEARAKLPVGQAIWPAIWMMPEKSVYGGWPVSGEIDIVELIGKEPGTIHGTLHFGNPHDQVSGAFSLPAGQSFADDYHVFAIEWEPGAIRWYLDGNEYFSATRWFTSAKNSPFPAPFDQPFYLIMNVAVGGRWPGYPNATTPAEAKMLVDYVRVYAK